MEIKKIISDYEKSLEEDKRQKELAHQKRILKLQFNAETLESFLKEIVEPVFHAAEKDITGMGYPCETSLVSRRPSFLPDSYRDFAIEIRLITKADKREDSSWFSLRYEGNFENQTITRIVTPKNMPPERSTPKALSSMSKEAVEKDVEEFVRRVFA